MARAWHFERLRLRRAWADFKTRGAGVTVALVDTGVADIAPLRHVLRVTADGAPAPADGHDRSGDAHGTKMASILAARDQRLPGIAPECECVAYGVADVRGAPVPSLLGRAIEDAVRRRVDLICCASTLPERPPALRRGLAAAAKARIPVLAAAGNNPNARPAFPAEHDEVVTIGATNRADKISGQYRWERWMPIAAPGYRVRTWDARGLRSREFSGTSAAAPIVAGVVALGLAHARALDPTGALARRVSAGLSALLRDTARRRRINPDAFMNGISAMASDASG